TYHRDLRSQASVSSQLEKVPGIGSKRRLALLKAFGSVDAIRAASVDELVAVPGMSRAAAEAIKENL
ncbi:MAG: excinuclease ABC subunit UvrC, partial [Anaerolineae bacterium]|nr:excinuclease ABC subunit UvrC [Anaerolineae bacterium]